MISTEHACMLTSGQNFVENTILIVNPEVTAD